MSDLSINAQTIETKTNNPSGKNLLRFGDVVVNMNNVEFIEPDFSNYKTRIRFLSGAERENKHGNRAMTSKAWKLYRYCIENNLIEIEMTSAFHQAWDNLAKGSL